MGFAKHTIEDFNALPICLPSSARIFDRNFHKGEILDVTVTNKDTVIFATDAVAKWVFLNGTNRELTAQAFDEIEQNTHESWADFISKKRMSEEMIDDDCTAVIVTFYNDGIEIENDLLGITQALSNEDLVQRKNTFIQAMTSKIASEVAVAWGDGSSLSLSDLGTTATEVERCRQIATALGDIFTEVKVINPNSNKIPKTLIDAWTKHRSLLIGEVCAIKLLNTLKELGLCTDSMGLR